MKIETPPVSSNTDYQCIVHKEYCEYLVECNNHYSCYSSFKSHKCAECLYTKQLKSIQHE